MAILAQLQRLFSPRQEKERTVYLYQSLMAQARQERFYTVLSVPDTLDGRYEMVVLHLFLVLERLKHAFDTHPPAKETSRLLMEIFIADMDRTLREMGVGDTGIKRRMKLMTSGFYGRMDAYTNADDDTGMWHEALRRNVYGTLEMPPEAAMDMLLAYIRQSRAALAQQDIAAIEAGKPAFKI